VPKTRHNTLPDGTKKTGRRPAAQRDLAAAVRYLHTEGGTVVSHRFLRWSGRHLYTASVLPDAGHPMADDSPKARRLTTTAPPSLPLLGVLSSAWESDWNCPYSA